jgi:hypothetical protein
MEEAQFSETLLSNNHTTRRNNPKKQKFHRLRLFENRVLWRIFGSKREEVA